ncbi:MAG: FeoA family protein [Bacteroidota bacterium]|nr:FeoA family protein [Bacteroidota bacterium]
MKTIANLTKGEKGIIEGFHESSLSVKFLEMGCIPGSEVEMCCVAPLGSPICIKVCGYHLALRKEEANQITLMEVECPVIHAIK